MTAGPTAAPDGPRFRRHHLETAAFAAALAALCLFTIVFRFLALETGFLNDHYVHLVSAQQMLLGEWPTRDFLDHGMPLMFAASALAQLVFGRTLFGEAVLVVSAMTLAVILTATAVRALTRSSVLAVVAAALQVAIVPREYAWPKLLFYALGFWLLQRYVARPTAGRQFAMAAATVVAFLFRHDHGIYLGIAGVLAMWLTPGVGSPPPGGPRISARIRNVGRFAAMGTVLVLPYLVYVQVFGGLWPYVQRGLVFRDSEFSRQPHVWPALGEEPYLSVLVYTFWALPLVSAAFVLARRRHDPAMVARVLPISAVAMLVNMTAMRSPLLTRLPDVVVPPLVLGAWLTALAWQARQRWLWGTIATLMVVLVARSVIVVARTGDQLERAGLYDQLSRVPSYLPGVAASLRTLDEPRLLPSRASMALAPFYPYVRRCTSPEHRLLVVGSIPEAPFFTQRPFAGGQSILAIYRSDEDQRRVLRTLREQQVPFVLLPGPGIANDFGSEYPLVSQWVRVRYRPLVHLGDETNGVTILIDSTLRAQRTDPATGWPCLISSE